MYLSVLLTFAAAEHSENTKDSPTAHTLFTSLIDRLSTEAEDLKVILTKEVEYAMGPEIPRLATGNNENEDGNMDIDNNNNNNNNDDDTGGSKSEYTRLVEEREKRGEMVREKRGRDLEEVREAMGVVWVMYMRFARRAEVSWKGGSIQTIRTCLAGHEPELMCAGYQSCASGIWQSEEIAPCHVASVRSVR